MNGAAKPSVHHTYALASSSSSSDQTISITLSEPTLKADGLSLTTWGSSLVLANLLHALDLGSPAPTTSSQNAPLDILELGAGTGLVGLTAAALLGRGCVLTDLDPIVPALEANVALNADALAKSGGDARAGALDWNEPGVLHVRGAKSVTTTTTRAQLILAADTMYTAEHPLLLSRVIAAWLRKDEGARAVVCYPLRVAYLDEIREFWERMEGLGLVALCEGRKMVEEEVWDDERENEWSVWGWRRE